MMKNIKMMPQVSAIVCSFICLIIFFIRRENANLINPSSFDKNQSKKSKSYLKQVLIKKKSSEVCLATRPKVIFHFFNKETVFLQVHREKPLRQSTERKWFSKFHFKTHVLA